MVLVFPDMYVATTVIVFSAAVLDVTPGGWEICAPQHVTDWHYDFQENFTMQLRGSKRWHFRKSGVTRPIRGFTPHFRSSSEIVEMQVKVWLL